MEGDFKNDREYRYKRISERIRNFLISNSTCLEILLYKDEIPRLESDMPEILITRERPCKGKKQKYWCTIFRKRIVE